MSKQTKISSLPSPTWKKIVQQKWLFFMLIPGIIWMIIFNYIPMYGIIIAFKDFTIGTLSPQGVPYTMLTAPWVGFKNFIDFFTDEKFWLVMRNTLGISVLKLIFGFPFPIILAILLNEIYHSKFKKFVQTISYLPHFFSWVILGGMLITWLSEAGIVNELLAKFSILEKNKTISFLTEPKIFWPLAISSDIWKELGWNAIIYLAAIAGIDPTLYEAATIDGANKLQKILYITLPSIKGVITILLVLSISGILNTNFEQILVLQNKLNIESSEVIDTLVYKLGIQQGRFSYATAVGLFKSIIAMILLFSANYATKKLNDRTIF